MGRKVHQHTIKAKRRLQDRMRSLLEMTSANTAVKKVMVRNHQSLSESLPAQHMEKPVTSVRKTTTLELSALQRNLSLQKMQALRMDQCQTCFVHRVLRIPEQQNMYWNTIYMTICSYVGRRKIQNRNPTRCLQQQQGQ